MAPRELTLHTIAWPVSRLGELIENLARRSRLIRRAAHLAHPSDRLAHADAAAVNQWVDVAAGHLGLEAEAVEFLYTEVEQFLKEGAPAVLRLPGAAPESPSLLALVRANRRRVTLLTPELRLRRVRLDALRDLICKPFDESLVPEIDALLNEAQVPPNRFQYSRRAILSEHLGALRLSGGWLLRLSPGTSLKDQLIQSGMLRPTVIQLVMYVLLQLITIASWIMIGRGVFQGSFDYTWLAAWAILLFSAIPTQMIVSDAQTEMSLRSGAVFKQRLMAGTLRLEPDEIRHQGRGQFLNRVMDADAVEMLALNGGYLAVLAVIELVLAGVILLRGAGGALQAIMLAVWTFITLVVLWQYYINTREWSSAYREMTNDLVEHMVGHQTRLVQEDRQRWHSEEDLALDRYLKLSESLDQVGVTVNALINRGWIVVGLAGLAVPFITGTASPQSLAISLGGVLLASRALGRMVGGFQSLVGLFIAWGQVGPLFKAAARPRELQALDFVSLQAVDRNPPTMTSATSAQPLLQAREINFRYRPFGRATIQDCSLEIHPGDRLLLEGSSGGGKSTLASLLTGLRKPLSGSLLLWGYDRQILGSDEWRQRIVMAPQFQENYVFSDTLAFNLLMGRRWPPLPEDLEAAEAVLRELGLGEVFDRMPSGFQQMLGESGWQLSHGERSRLFIARTLLQKADLIVLDESFGALDPENLQRSLQCVLNRAPTLMVIAHP